MHKHTHECTECQHDCLHHCKCCDKVYCCKCGQEWGGTYYYSYPYYPTTAIPNITWGTTTYVADSAGVCTHSH